MQAVTEEKHALEADLRDKLKKNLEELKQAYEKHELLKQDVEHAQNQVNTANTRIKQLEQEV